MIMRHKTELALLLLAVVLLCSFTLQIVAGNNFKDSHVVFVDVGQGDCIHFRTESGGNYLVDGGGSINYNVGKKTLKPYLLKNGATSVDGAFVTHLHTDHYKGVAELCREGMVKKLFLYEGNKAKEDEIIKDTGLDREDIVYLYKGQRVMLDKDVCVDVVWPDRQSDTKYEGSVEENGDENLSSLILKINVKDHSILATADIDKECLEDIAGEWGKVLKSDIVKVPHHGSKFSYSEAFVEFLEPDYAVFQVGKNNFGHPDKGVVEKYLENDIIVLRNDIQGAIAFQFIRNGCMKVMTVAGEEV